MKRCICLNKGWKFKEHNVHENSSYVRFFMDSFNVDNWQDVNVPHDNSIVSEFAETNPSGARGGYAKTTMCYYNKIFSLSKEDIAKRVLVEFQGVYMNGKVYVNGNLIGQYPYGYTTFSYDISAVVREGDNRLSVVVDNEVQPGSRWYSGTGIYRPVHLYITEDVYFEKEDIFITTPVVTDQQATVDIDFKIFNASKLSKRVETEIEITFDDKTVCKTSIDKAVAYENHTSIKTSFKIDYPQLWCNATPNLYKATFKMFMDGEQIDQEDITFGVRSIQYTPDSGFVINGKKEMLKGVCIHHDNGCLGAAAYREAFVRKIEAVKAMGANAIRTSHNPESPEFLDLCDKYGMYVMEEAFDEWVLGKRPRIFGDIFIRQRIFSYANYFDQWAEKDLSAMVKRDRNHPSIVMWSIGNEIEELRHEEGEGIAQMLVNIVHKHDTTRPATAAFNGLGAINKTNNPEILDICGYNYAEAFYADDHASNPQRCIVGSETASVAAFEERGKYDAFIADYNMEKKDIDPGADPEQAAIKESVASFVRARMTRGEASMMKHLENDFIAGMFIWTGIDYIGEPTPQTWPSISSYFAPIDRAYLPKDSFYFYKSCWSDEAVLHILPHWNLENVDKISVWCFSNCDEVELFVNGKSYGNQVLDRSKSLHYEWKEVLFEKGLVKAVGKRGGEIIETIVKTANDLEDFIFTSDRDQVREGELFYTKIQLVDSDGTVVPHQDWKVSFTTSGNVSFVACDNGSPKHSDFNATGVDTLSGYAIGIFKGTEKGSGEVIATMEIKGKTVEHRLNISVK